MEEIKDDLQKNLIENKTEPILVESEESLDFQINCELENINELIGVLELDIASSLDAKEREEMAKEKNEFLKRLAKLGKKSTENKLKKIMKLKEDIESIVGGLISFEEKNEKDFDNLLSATNKWLEDLRKKHDQFVLDNKLNESEREPLDQIISVYKELIQEAVSENNKEKLEGIGYDIKADLEGDIQIEEEEIETVDSDKKTESENFDRKAIMQDFNSFFNKLRTKLGEFEAECKDDSGKEAREKLGKNIRYWARKIKDFEDVENPSNEDMARMLQLHDEVEKWAKANWMKLHKAGKFELSTRDELEEENMREKYDFSRKAADITFAKVDRYEELNAQNEKEGDEKFKEVTRKILEDLVVHGRLEKNEKTGKFEVVNKTDLDCKAALGFLKLAGVNIDKVEYVAPGETREGKINIDTGNKEGLYILEDGTVVIDHHGPDSPNNTSAAHKVYDILASLGMLDIKKDDYLRDLVKFVDRVDNFNYPKFYYRNYFKESWKSLFGLSKMLEWDELVNFFQYRDPETGEKLNPEKPLNSGLMQKFRFIKKIKNKETGEVKKEVGKAISNKERISKSKEELEKMEQEGFIIDSERYGKICLNIDGRVLCGIDAAKAFGCDTILSWSTNGSSFAISSLKGRTLEDDFSDGLNVRKTLWINPGDRERHVTLIEILNKMTDGKFEPSEAVKNILEVKEIQGTENEEKEDEAVELSENINEAAENTEEVLADLNHEEIGHPAPETVNEDMPVIDEFEIEDAMEFAEEEKVLSSEELKKVLSLERREKMGENREALRKKFGSFVLNHRGEEFCKVMLHRILDLDDKFAQINRKFKKMEESDEMDENILNEINKLDGEIINLVESDWENELKKFKQNSINEKFGFNEKEQQLVEKSKEVINRYIENARAEFSLENFPQGRIEMTVETQAVFFLMEEFKKRKFFAGNEENVAEFIIKNRK